jgi:predicted RNA methylase
MRPRDGATSSVACGSTRDDGVVTDPSTTTVHWEGAYARGEQALSWYTPSAAVSLRLITAANVATSAAVIDIGGGTSRLVDALIERGVKDLSVLDVSDAALVETQRRLTGHATKVRWLVQDIRGWRPHRTYGLWHDRAVFHFQANHADRDAYLYALNTGTAPGSVAVFATFAPDGPTQCSGLPVRRYSPEQIAETLGDQWQLESAEHEEHTTPAGIVQPFSWALLRRK